MSGHGAGGQGSRGSGSETPKFGHTELPEEQRTALKRAIRLEWITLAAMALSVVVVFLVSGSSQAMKAAWIEDTLSLLPPIAFLVAAKVIRKTPSDRHPYGYHRAIGVAHLVAAVALLGLGAYLVIDSGMGLVSGERPPMGTVVLFGGEPGTGWQIWSGWLMIAAMGLVSIGPPILGHLKQKPARILHDKVLYADADMSKADWQSALATIVGILGVGAGLWWADAAAALFVGAGIVKDGVTLLRDAVRDLADARPTTYDGKSPEPVLERMEEELRSLLWVREARVRMRDEGHVFHAEAFVVPKPGAEPTLERLAEARHRATRIDWRVRDTAIVPVAEVPEEQVPRG